MQQKENNNEYPSVLVQSIVGQLDDCNSPKNTLRDFNRSQSPTNKVHSISKGQSPLLYNWKHHGLRVTKIEQAIAKPLDFRTRVHTPEISDDENMGNPFRYS